MGVYVSLADVQVDYGDVAPDDQEKVETLIDRAEARIEQAVGPISMRVADGGTSIVLVKQVVSEMVTAVLRNPNGWRSQTETTGPFSRSNTIDVSTASGLLRLTPSHRVLLGAGNAASVGPVIGHPGTACVPGVPAWLRIDL